jgi:hypothetical protein
MLRIGWERITRASRLTRAGSLDWLAIRGAGLTVVEHIPSRINVKAMDLAVQHHHMTVERRVLLVTLLGTRILVCHSAT